MLAGEKARVLAEGAFLTTVTVLLGILGLSFPPLYYLIFMFIPLPLIVFVRRYHIKYGLPVLLLADAFIFGLAPESSSALLLIVYFNGLGLLYGLLFKNHVPVGRSILTGAGLSVILVLLVVFIVFIVAGVDLFELDQKTRHLMLQNIEVYRQAGVFNGIPVELQTDLINKAVDTIELFMPGQLIVTVIITSVITYLLAHRVFIRLRYQLTPIPPFSKVRFPWYMVWGLIAGLGFTLLGDFLFVSWLGKTGKNLLFILFHVFLVPGLSVAVFYYFRLNFAGWAKFLLLLLLIFYFPLSMVILFLLGVIDSLANLRGLPEEK